MDVEVSKMILKISYEVEAGYLWRKKSSICPAFTECLAYIPTRRCSHHHFVLYRVTPMIWMITPMITTPMITTPMNERQMITPDDRMTDEWIYERICMDETMQMQTPVWILFDTAGTVWRLRKPTSEPRRRVGYKPTPRYKPTSACRHKM